MERTQLIQTLMEQKGFKNYLEIGVSNGHVFFKVKGTFKVAVDPEFKFNIFRKIGKAIVNTDNLFNKYFSKTSDDFFALDAPQLFAQKKVEIALIDGMHEYEFALRDVENVLNYLENDGIIIMHDCNPKVKKSASTYKEWETNGMDYEWNGDVWKTILHLRTFRNDIDVFVLDTDHGLGIIAKRKSENSLNYSLQEIISFTYEDFDANREHWINLKPVDFIYEYFNIKE